MNCEYVKKYYGVQACIGRRVIAYGKPGIIADDRGHYIGILLDCDKPGDVNNYHPTDGIEYLDQIGKVRPMSRSQKRYRAYLRDGDCFDSFIDFCKWYDNRHEEVCA